MPDRSGLTLMAVHAHPDDEASSTGGILCKYASEGVRTVLVVCTNGEFGDVSGGIKPDDPAHDGAAVIAQRQRELERSCELLQVSDLELLGYRDSGMMGWPQNDAPDAFWNTSVEVAADRLAELMERYRPQVVVTYDENGFYGHPDHIQANRITLAAFDKTGIASKLYYPVIPRSELPRFAEVLRTAGFEPPPEAADALDFGAPDEMIAARMDCSEFAERKFQALEAHGSQADNAFFLRLGVEVFAQVFGTESFVRARDVTGAPVPEADLFDGVAVLSE
ncbi:MAG: PIG-L family deacetylase [Acidimicrobiales bacterium]